MRSIVMALVLVMVVVMPGEVSAQDCELDAWTGRLSDALLEVEAAMDFEEWTIAVSMLRQIVNEAHAECSGYQFSSDDSRGVIGPLTFAPGFYIAAFSTPDDGQVDVREMSGDCDQGNLFLVFNGEAAEGVEAVFEVEAACEVLIEVNAEGEPWELGFAPLD